MIESSVARRARRGIGLWRSLGAEIQPMPAVPITTQPTGPAAIASYTVAHGRDGAPDWGLIIADLPDGTRAYARGEDQNLLADLEAREWVGRELHLEATERGVNLARA